MNHGKLEMLGKTWWPGNLSKEKFVGLWFAIIYEGMVNAEGVCSLVLVVAGS
jgi:hypothetical protein